MRNINRAYLARQAFVNKANVATAVIESITQKKVDNETRTFLLDTFKRIPDLWTVRRTGKNTMMIEAPVSIDGEIINTTCVLPHQRLTPEDQSPTQMAHYIMMLVFSEAIERYLHATK